MASLGAGVQPQSTVQLFMPVSAVEKPLVSQLFSRLWGVIWRGKACRDQQIQFLTRNKSLSSENDSNCSITSEAAFTRIRIARYPDIRVEGTRVTAKRLHVSRYPELLYDTHAQCGANMICARVSKSQLSCSEVSLVIFCHSSTLKEPFFLVPEHVACASQHQAKKLSCGRPMRLSSCFLQSSIRRPKRSFLHWIGSLPNLAKLPIYICRKIILGEKRTSKNKN